MQVSSISSCLAVYLSVSITYPASHETLNLRQHAVRHAVLLPYMQSDMGAIKKTHGR